MIGLPINRVNRERADMNRENYDYVAVASTPEATTEDRMAYIRILVPFLSLLVINVIVTSLLYTYASTADSTKVEPNDSYLPSEFQMISDTRLSRETTLYVFTIMNLILGGIGCMIYSATLIWSYQTILIILTLISGVNAPSFVYLFRLILDAIMYHMAEQIKHQFMINMRAICQSGRVFVDN